jgi:hypothetical protein
MRREPLSGREDDIVKIMQVEGAKYIITRGPTGAKGRPNRAEVGPGRPAQPTLVAGSAPFPLHPKDLQPKNPGGAAIR